MAAPGALCDPIATTSLFADLSDDEDDYANEAALTLKEASAEYARLREAGAVSDEFEWRTTAEKFIVVQLRKRRGKVELLLDGRLSEGAPETRDDGKTVLVHKIDWHKGLHEDSETRTRALSPLAVACAVEDGQRALRQVTASVWLSYMGIDATSSWQLLGESNVSPHRVSDPRCRVVAMPYPVTFRRHPFVHIWDDRVKRASKNTKRLDALGKLIATVGSLASTLIEKGAPVSEVLSLSPVGAALAFFMSWYLDQVVPNATETVSGLAKEVPWVLSLAAAGVPWQVLLLAAFAKVRLRRRLFTNPKKERKVQFSLQEFARSIEVITAANAAPAPEDDENNTSNRAIFERRRSPYGRNERILWDWLASDAGDRAKDRAEFGSDDLRVQPQTGMVLRLMIHVDDAFECAAGGEWHELCASRDDAFFLSAAAAGVLEDLKRVVKAIKALQNVLGPPEEGLVWPKAKSMYRFHVARPFEAMRRALLKRLNLDGAMYKKNLLKDAQWAAAVHMRELEEIEIDDLINARKALKQLEACFVDERGDGARLRRRIEIAILAKGRPRSDDAVLCTRLLPQRVGRANFSYQFRAGQRLSTQHVDEVQDLGAIIRQFSEYDEAGSVMQASMKGAFAYLRRAVPEWEARSATRVVLRCACRESKGFEKAKAKGVQRLCSTLALTTPVDVHFAAAVARLPEDTLRSIRLVVRRAQQKCDASSLETLGLKHTSEDLLACQVFGDLWANELVALAESDREPGVQEQMQMLEQASRRAAARLRASGTLLLALFTVLPQTELKADEDDDIAPELSDVAFSATLAGRDAHLLIRKLLFARDDFEVRSVMTPVVRRSAAAAVRAAAAFEREVPARLPHEPLASLFGPRWECVAALDRAEKLVGTDNDDDGKLKNHIVSAYASSRLMGADEIAATLREVRANPLSPFRESPDPSVVNLLAALRFRMASLRMDYDPIDVVRRIDALSLDDLTTELAVAKGDGHDFYVPFGFGDARPAPTLPPCPAPMFGTVPVRGAHLQSAFESIASVLAKGAGPDDAADARELRVRLEPLLRCVAPLGPSNQETRSVHPNVVQVIDKGKGRRLATRFSASRSRLGSIAKDVDKTTVVSCTTEDTWIAQEVSTIAWNAERVVQCVVAALASAEGANDLQTVGLELELPSHDQYRESWYNEQQQYEVDDLRQIEQDVKDEETDVFLQLAEGRATLHQLEEELKELKKQNRSTNLKEAQINAAQINEKIYQDAYEHIQQKKKLVEEWVKIREQRVAFVNESSKRSQRLLLGSVGLAMAMLAELIRPVRVALRLVEGSGSIEAEKLDPVAERFARCEAVRLSEACIVISQKW